MDSIAQHSEVLGSFLFLACFVSFFVLLAVTVPLLSEASKEGIGKFYCVFVFSVALMVACASVSSVALRMMDPSFASEGNYTSSSSDPIAEMFIINGGF